jgi:DNA-directed RNA polymerase subunit RPC12/RpoP
MRILVLEEENGTARLKESREDFGIIELKLSYTCTQCKTQFVFAPDKSDPTPKWSKCPVCPKELEVKTPDVAIPITTLWDALGLYREFYKVAARLPELRLLVIRPGQKPDAVGSPRESGGE